MQQSEKAGKMAVGASRTNNTSVKQRSSVHVQEIDASSGMHSQKSELAGKFPGNASSSQIEFVDWNDQQRADDDRKSAES
jgi:hypothetical protein